MSFIEVLLRETVQSIRLLDGELEMSLQLNLFVGPNQASSLIPALSAGTVL